MTRRRVQEKVKKSLKIIGKLFAKIICIFDDIPFLLHIRDTGNIGPFMLVGAGFLIFPVQGAEAVSGLVKALQRGLTPAARRPLLAASLTKLMLSIIGFAASAALLAFILTNLAMLAAAASICIPGMMAAISGVELIHDIHACFKSNDTKKAAAKVTYSAIFFGFGLAITALAALSTLTTLGILSLGIIPAAILVGVVAAALAVKIFQIVDNRKNAAGEKTHPLTTGIKNFWHQLTSCHKPAHRYTPISPPSEEVSKMLYGQPPASADIQAAVRDHMPKQLFKRRTQSAPALQIHHSEDYRTLKL